MFSPQSVRVRRQVAVGVPRRPPYGHLLRRVAACHIFVGTGSVRRREDVSRKREELASPSDRRSEKDALSWVSPSTHRGGMFIQANGGNPEMLRLTASDYRVLITCCNMKPLLLVIGV